MVLFSELMLVGFVLRLLNTMFAERAAPVLDLYVLFWVYNQGLDCA